MSKQLVHNFSIKPAFIAKIKRESRTSIKVGKMCHGVIIKDADGILKVRLTQSPVEERDDKETSEFRVLPLTPKSFVLKDKTYVFAKFKDKYNHPICIIRTETTAHLHPGLNTQYDALREGLLIAGHVVKRDDKYLFDYEALVAFTELGAHINEPILISSKI